MPTHIVTDTPLRELELETQLERERKINAALHREILDLRRIIREHYQRAAS